MSRSVEIDTPCDLAKSAMSGMRMAGMPETQLAIVDTGVPNFFDMKGRPPSLSKSSDRSAASDVSADSMTHTLSIKRTKVNPLNGWRATKSQEVEIPYNVGMTTGSKPPGRQPHTPADRRVKKQVGANLIRARKAMGLEQESFAELMGMAASTWNKYEYGISFPKPQHFERLHEIGISIDFLISGRGSPTLGPVDITALLKARKRAG